MNFSLIKREEDIKTVKAPNTELQVPPISAKRVSQGIETRKRSVSH